MSVTGFKKLFAIFLQNESKDETGRAPLLRIDRKDTSAYGTADSALEQGVEDRGKMRVYSEEQLRFFFGKVDPRMMSDLIIGLSDGLTVPFALTAGLSLLGDTRLVIMGGFAELISGTISMGLGGYLGARSESDYYYSEVKLEKLKFYNNTQSITHEIEDILLDINSNFSADTIVSFIKDLQKDPESMVDFIIRFGRGLEVPTENRQIVSAVTIGSGYFIGGFIPLIPYMFVNKVGTGLFLSIVLMVITLFVFGFVKCQISMSNTCSFQKKCIEGFQIMSVGGAAAAAAWFCVRFLG